MNIPTSFDPTRVIIAPTYDALPTGLEKPKAYVTGEKLFFEYDFENEQWVEASEGGDTPDDPDAPIED